jgi:hypothetical protein
MLVTLSNMLMKIFLAKIFILSSIIHIRMITHPEQQVNYKFPRAESATDTAKNTLFMVYEFPNSIPFYMDNCCILTWILGCPKKP